MKHATFEATPKASYTANALGDGCVVHGNGIWADPMQGVEGALYAALKAYVGPLPSLPGMMRINTAGWGAQGPITVDDTFDVTPIQPSRIELGIISPVIDVFRAGQLVEAFVYAPGRSGQRVVVEVMLNTLKVQEVSLTVSDHGVAILRIEDLDAGAYVLRFQEPEFGGFEFPLVVANFELSKLSVSDLETIIGENTVTVKGYFRILGKRPYRKAVMLRLLQNNLIFVTGVVEPGHDGYFEYTFSVAGTPGRVRGIAQAVNNPSHVFEWSYSNGIAGDEANKVVINRLGVMRTVSTVPSFEGQECVHDLYVTDGVEVGAPLYPLSNHGKTVRFKLQKEFTVIKPVIWNPFTNTYTHFAEQRGYSEGDIFNLPIDAPFCVVLLHAWYQDHVGGKYIPYFASVPVMRTADWKIRFDHPERVDPGDYLRVNAGLEGLNKDLMIAIMVSNTEASATLPSTQIARLLVNQLGDIDTWMGEPRIVRRTLKEIFEEENNRRNQWPYHSSGRSSRFGDNPTVPPPPPTLPAPVVQRALDVYMDKSSSVVKATGFPVSQGALEIPMPVSPGIYRIVMFANDPETGFWQQAVSTVEVHCEQGVEGYVPEYLVPGIKTEVQLTVQSPSGTATLACFLNGNQLEVRREDGQLTSTLTTPTPVSLTLHSPGLLEVEVTDTESSELVKQEYLIQDPQRLSRTAVRYHIAHPQLEDTVEVNASDLGATAMWVSYGMFDAIEQICEAMLAYEAISSDELSSQMLAAIFLYLMRNTSNNNALPELNTALRLASLMHTRVAMSGMHSGYVQLYPDAREQEPYSFTRITVGNLLVLGMFESMKKEIDHELYEVINRLYRRGSMLSNTYEYRMGKRDSLTSAWHAYVRFVTNKFGEFPEKTVAQEAVDYCLLQVQSLWPDYDLQDQPEYAAGLAGLISEVAYSAAVLALDNQEEAAIDRANFCLRHLGASGMGHGSIDSLAILVMLEALAVHKIGVTDHRLQAGHGWVSLQQLLSTRETFQTLSSTAPCVLAYTVPVHEDREALFAGQGDHIFALSFRNSSGRPLTSINVGEEATLVVDYLDETFFGDMVEIILPPCLINLEGGKSIQRTMLDFRGMTEAALTVVGVSSASGMEGQIFLGLHNRYDDTRTGYELHTLVVNEHGA